MPEGIFKIQEHQDKTLRESVWELTPDSKLKCIIKGNSRNLCLMIHSPWKLTIIKLKVNIPLVSSGDFHYRNSCGPVHGRTAVISIDIHFVCSVR